MPGTTVTIKIVCCIFFLLHAHVIAAQQLSRPDNLIFYQLAKEQGLSANSINTLCTDKNNNLWIGTIEGLNRFNGKTVIHYLSQNYPQLANDNILGLLCDEQNRIWVQCDDGAAVVIDENRRFHKVLIQKNNKVAEIRRVIITKKHGTVLYTKSGFFVYSGGQKIIQQDSLTQNDFLFLPITGIDTLASSAFVQLEKLDENRFALTRRQDIHIINFSENKIEARYNIANKWVLHQWKPGELLMYDRNFKLLESLQLSTQNITYPFSDIKDQNGKLIGPRVHSVKALNNGNLLIATYRDGIYILNTAQKKLTQYLHRPGDLSSPPTNRPVSLHTTSDGWVFFGSRYNGVSYFKHGTVIGQKKFFSDNAGNSYDGYINSIVQKNNEEYYIGASTNLLRWNRFTNKTTFVNYGVIDGKPVINEEGATILATDRLGRLWFLTSTKGIVVLDKNEKLLKRFAVDTVTKNGLMAIWAEYITNGKDGWVWIGTQNGGIRRINPVNFEIDNLSTTPFNQLKDATCIDIFFDDPGYIWVATSGKGLWKYNTGTGTMHHFTAETGFISNRVYAVEKDEAGNIYIGTDRGMQIFYTTGRIKRITTGQGLVNNRVNILMRDKQNRMWMGNANGIGCYNPADSTLKYFDQSYGLSVEEIRAWAYFAAEDGELFWGTEKGIEFFYPTELYKNKSDLQAYISRVETGQLKQDVTGSKQLTLTKGDNNITFYFNTSGFLPQVWSFYQYKLEGQDKDWIQVTNQNSVRYNSLSPGKYTFKLKASADNKNWIDAGNVISVYIPPPVYKTWWFKIMAAVLAAAVLFTWLKKREKAIKTKEKANTELHKLKAENYKLQLETEQVTGFFTSTIHQHTNIDELLWNVAKNLIGKLGFEECMIYLWNDDKTILVQRAGYGLKGDMQVVKNKEGYNIPKGKGIVGAAAASGRYVLVNDTSKDSRYFSADEKIMFSELSVPLIQKGEVAGVINTEHSKKNFFNDKHVKMLSTIASLCAGKMEKIKAEEQAHEKEMELLKLNKDLATSQLTTLRAQMNPHFIFNALNSVQQYILKGSITEANRYLSKFSRLQRQVLNHSDHDFIPLEKELEILNLYLELEQLRFEGNFTCQVIVHPDIDPDEIKIPPMIVQPFVENAIWHGLMPKKGDKHLQITFSLPFESVLLCTVRDNGIGREAAARIKNNTHPLHASKGLSLVYDRLAILRQQYGQVFDVQIHDVKNDAGHPEGTEVILQIYTS